MSPLAVLPLIVEFLMIRFGGVVVQNPPMPPPPPDVVLLVTLTFVRVSVLPSFTLMAPPLLLLPCVAATFDTLTAVRFWPTLKMRRASLPVITIGSVLVTLFGPVMVTFRAIANSALVRLIV